MCKYGLNLKKIEKGKLKKQIKLRLEPIHNTNWYDRKNLKKS